MGMDWTEEPWVKLYIRDTVQWLMLPWQAQGLLCLFFRKVNRAGVLDYGDAGLPGVARVIAGSAQFWPEMEPFFAKLLANGVVVDEPERRRLVVPNFVEAQRARQSAKLRAKTMRDREAAGLKEPAPRKRPVDEPAALPPAPPAPSGPPTKTSPVQWDDLAQRILTASRNRVSVLRATPTLQQEFREQCVQCSITLGNLDVFGREVARDPVAVWSWLASQPSIPKTFTLDWLRFADQARGDTPWKRFREGVEQALALDQERRQHAVTRRQTPAPADVSVADPLSLEEQEELKRLDQQRRARAETGGSP